MKKLVIAVVVFVCASTGLFAQEITDDQFEKFVVAFQQVQQQNNNAQAQMVAVIEDEGLTAQRFNEIHQASLDPSNETDASEKEKKQHQAAVVKLEEMNQGLQNQMVDKIKEAGLTLEDYQVIFQKIQTDPEMQQKLQKRFMGEGQ